MAARRADAQRNIDAILNATKEVFRTVGVDATVRDVAARAGIGVATLYRHFPQRSDLVAAVYRREVDLCAAAASTLARERQPFAALAAWLQRFSSFIATKRGLAAALRSGDPALDGLPAYFRAHLEPALESLLEAAIAAGEVDADVNAYELLQGIGILSVSSGEEGHRAGRRMIELILAGLRKSPRGTS